MTSPNYEQILKDIDTKISEVISRLRSDAPKWMSNALLEFQNSYSGALEFYNKATQVAKQMAAQYQVKKSAFERKNESFKSTGQINLSRLANYKTSDEIFHNKSNVRQAGNHGLIVMLDISQSMHNSVEYLAKQFLITALYAKFSNIHTEIYTFTNFNGTENDFTIQELINQSSTINQIRNMYFGLMLAPMFCNNTFLNVVDVTNIFNEEFINKLLNELPISKKQMGGTPLFQASVFAYHRAMALKSSGIENVSITFLTDGEATDDNGINITVTCPYSNRSFNIDGNRNSLQVINKIIRLQNIKIFNIFIEKENSTLCKLRASLLRYIKYKNVDNKLLNEIESIKTDGNKENAIAINELLDYNTFYAIAPKLNKRESNSQNVKKTLLNTIEEMKAYSTLGEHLNTTICQDFSLI